jgi:hypothetical protein
MMIFIGSICGAGNNSAQDHSEYKHDGPHITLRKRSCLDRFKVQVIDNGTPESESTQTARPMG